ncbi:DUF433 domain-containing protein [Ilyomonas limi]|uniref:DUF433 domain-containing protein n=1 Tax=Ilyomonas limi TaxID=2575867 RepID=UPI00198162A9
MEEPLKRITVDNNILDGKPCIRGKRISVQTILEFLSAGDSHEDILYQYPFISISFFRRKTHRSMFSIRCKNFRFTLSHSSNTATCLSI